MRAPACLNDDQYSVRQKLPCLIIFILNVLISSVVFTKLALANELNATNVAATQNGQVILTFSLKDGMAKPSSFVTQAPSTIVIDFPDTQSKLKTAQQTIRRGPVDSLTVVADEKRTRAVINLNQILSQKDYRVLSNPKDKTISVVLRPQTKINNTAKLPLKAPAQTINQPYQVVGFDFRRGENGAGKFVVKLSSADVNVNISEKGNALMAQFGHTALPKRFQRIFNVADFGTPVNDVVLKQDADSTLVTLETSSQYKPFTYQLGQDFIIEAAPVANNGSESRQSANYKGARISLNFQDIKVRAVLQLLADFTGLNLITSDSVNGSITLRLKDVPWDQAFDIVLKSQGLAERRYGNVIMIAPSDELTNREKAELQAEQQVANLAPVTSELIQINYAKAKDLATLIKSTSGNAGSGLLSDRGAVSVDDRTNTLWVQDTAQKLAQIKEFIQKLDMPIRQVIIKARVVNVNSDFTKDLGIRFGTTRQPGVSGTLAGANQLRALPPGASPSVIASEFSGDSLTNRLNVDLPAPGRAGTFGIALANIGSGVLLDLELSALETEGGGEIISSPTLVTSNQKQATIEQGVEIPYEQATSSGATSVAFKKAVLSLDVTPQITPDDRLILTLKVNQDSQGQTIGNVPSIDTRQVQTQVLVNNGDTIVLGGVYTQNKLKTLQRVPFLGNLPLIGRLFRNTHVENKRSELLIFITPKIVQQKINEG